MGNLMTDRLLEILRDSERCEFCADCSGDDICAKCDKVKGVSVDELRAYYAHLTELVRAEQKQRVRQGQCIWCRNGAYMQQKYGRAVPDFCAHCGRDLRGESQND